jgi:beta-galactosidase
VTRWRERIEAGAGVEIAARFDDGDPAWLVGGTRHYLGGWPDAELMGAVIAKLAARAGLSTTPLPEGVRWRRRGDVTFAFNYGDEVFRAPGSAREFLLGGTEIGPSGVAAWRE